MRSESEQLLEQVILLLKETRLAQGLSHEKLAAALGMPLSALLARAEKRLR